MFITKKIYSLIVLLLLLTVSSICQTTIQKKDIVTPKFPLTHAVTFKESFLGGNKYSGDVSQTESGFAVNGIQAPSQNTFPLMRAYFVNKINVSKKGGGSIELVDKPNQLSRTVIRIVVPDSLDASTVFSQIFFKGPPDELLETEYFHNVEKAALAKTFNKDLAAVPFGKQQEIAKYLNYNLMNFHAAKFKDGSYFALNVTDDVVYNTNRVNAAERAARQTGSAIKKMSSAAKIFEPVEGIVGIKFEAKIFYRNFVDEPSYSTPHTENFEMYVPFELMSKFSEAEITNQDLVDGSVILVNDARVKVVLSNF